jgi:hypothetical protein
MKQFKSIVILGFLYPLAFISQTILLEGNIDWKAHVISEIDDQTSKTFFSFEDAHYNVAQDYIPFFSHQIKLDDGEIISLSSVEFNYENIDPSELLGVSGVDFIKENVDLHFVNGISRKINYGDVIFTPIRYNAISNRYQRVISYRITVNTRNKSKTLISAKKAFATNSVLRSGEWYKIAVVKEGIFKLSYQFLKELGFDIDNLNPNDFKIYGNGGKKLPALNSDFRVDDILQNAIYVEGASDNVFNENDFVLFYGQSPDSWSYNENTNLFEHEVHKYSDSTYYFLTFSNTGEAVKRISSQASSPNSTRTSTSFDAYASYEKDNLNLIKSGDMWFGELFDVKTDYDFVFNFPNLESGSAITTHTSVAARSSIQSTFVVSALGNSMNLLVSAVNTSSYTSPYAALQSGFLSFTGSSDVFNLNINYNQSTSSSLGWLDEIEVNASRELIMTGNQLFFRDTKSVGIGNVTQFTISNASTIAKLWDISDPFNVKEQEFEVQGAQVLYTTATDSLKEFVGLTSTFETQVFGLGLVENQNLHAVSGVDMIIVSHPDFLSQANQLQQFHESEGLSVVLVTPQQIYNEFSSGSQDVIAIRSFVRKLYKEAVLPNDLPKYLLLFGDGSYDNKDRETVNTNFIPTYQTPNSVDIIGSLVSDDYYGLLDDGEGTFLQAAGTELIDIAIGRLPVKTAEEADNVVHKILNYNVPSSMNEWRNRITFIGDDEDNNIHMYQSDFLAGKVELSNKEYNVSKVFFDAFQQEVTPGGARYPDVTNAINDAVNKGSLIVNYTGHGGETGWAHERVLTVSDVNNWTNTSGYPLFITATCEFSRFDDPHRTTAGELVLVGEHGGLGLLTTVRLVFSAPNFELNKSFYNEVFNPVNDEFPTIGEVFMRVKNLNAADPNNRNFTLLGDPALRLAYPKHDVITTQINGANISAADTLKALGKVTIQGELRNKAGNKLVNYNGIIYPTVFDKEKPIVSLQNDGGNAFNFDLQTNKLFTGKVSVTNGEFSYSFIVPKDISYNYGAGKLSYYAENQVEDANGFYTDFYIGGTAEDYAVDEVGPEIELFMNDEKFVFGGMTDENPILIANVSDVHGINMVGNGIGHDIIAILDGKSDEAFVLNDFYAADLNSYQKGRINFPFIALEEGPHQLTLKVWDVYNNSSEATIEFVVVKDEDIILDRVYNYPNPFTTYTEFWFEHNQPNKDLFAQVQVFTISGKLVKTLSKHVLNAGFRSTAITWNGLDEYGDRIGRGVYVYRLKVRTENYSVAEKYEKLVILR